MSPSSKLTLPGTALAACIALCACATPPTDTSLADARTAVQTAEADPAVARYEGVDLAVAQKHLALAENAAQHQAQPLVDHESYLAIRVARLSEVRADEAVAQERVAAAQRAKAGAGGNADADAANQHSAAAEGVVRELQLQIAGLSVQQSPHGAMVLLSDDYFDPGRAQLRPEAGRILDGIAQFLVAHAERRVRIEGHTDNTGSAAFNLELSLQRAEAVRVALVARGVEPARSEAVAYGPENAMAANPGGDPQVMRGVEILVSDGTGPIASR